MRVKRNTIVALVSVGLSFILFYLWVAGIDKDMEELADTVSAQEESLMEAFVSAINSKVLISLLVIFAINAAVLKLMKDW